MPDSPDKVSAFRRNVVLGLFCLAFVLLAARAFDLQILKQDFLRGEGDARHLRVVSIPAHRGMLLDRHGEPVAVSTPVESVWANPRETLQAPERIAELAQELGLDARDLRHRLTERASREFVYLRRHVNPDVAQRVQALGVPGIGLQREFRRYYPMGEVAGHVLGFTNIDDHGQEGIELAFNDRLTGQPGAKRVLRDRLGRVIRDVENIRPARPGKDVTLTLDQRVQYLAYRELKAAVQAHGARAGSLVVMDARTGEILAMVNQPAFNPNNRAGLSVDASRNRAVTDVFEPGSTIKPFTVAAALESGTVRPDALLDTAPGQFRVGRHTIRDIRNYGRIDLTTLIAKSSNIGATKLALDMESEALWGVFHRAGLGRSTSSGFPGEAAGLLRDFFYWRQVDRATLAFGYGLSVTPLQLAQAYAALANDGLMPAPRFVIGQQVRDPERVMSAETALRIRRMLEAAVAPEGSGNRAAVEAYRVAGKTGTVRKSGAGGYAEDRYVSVFAGMAPASAPRLVMVVTIDEPSGEEYYGGQVAAPVFSRVMQGALRLLDIAPDDLPELQRVSAGEGPA
jgi:cell division protein FtsI (penicillin-binding protein 3)